MNFVLFRSQKPEASSRGHEKPRFMLMLLPAFLALVTACESPRKTTASLYPELILSRQERLQDIALKEGLIRELLNREGLSAVLLTSPDDVSWATSGAESCIPVFILSNGRKFFFARPGVSSGGVLEDLVDMGFEAKAEARKDDSSGPDPETLAVITGGQPFGADASCRGGKIPGLDISPLQVPLTGCEVREYQWLGRIAAEQVEDVCRRLEPGMTDCGVEALLSDALLRHAIHVAAFDVGLDARVPGGDGNPRTDVSKLERHAIVGVCAERWGLRVELTRLVHFGPLTKESRKQLDAAARINAGFWARTLPGASFESILRGASADYADESQAGEWLRRALGGPIGYKRKDWTTFSGTQTINTPAAFAWKVTVGDFRIEDTVLLAGDRIEVLTETSNWPRLESKALGRIYRSPGVLER